MSTASLARRVARLEASASTAPVLVLIRCCLIGAQSRITAPGLCVLRRDGETVTAFHRRAFDLARPLAIPPLYVLKES